MNNEEYNKVYNEALNEVTTILSQTTKTTKHSDTSGMSKKELRQVISDLEDNLHELQSKLLIRESVNNRYIKGLIDSKYNQAMQLLHDPIITLPSGKQICFSSLSDEQLDYLEQLASKKHL